MLHTVNNLTFSNDVKMPYYPHPNHSPKSKEVLRWYTPVRR